MYKESKLNIFKKIKYRHAPKESLEELSSLYDLKKAAKKRYKSVVDERALNNEKENLVNEIESLSNGVKPNKKSSLDTFLNRNSRGAEQQSGKPKGKGGFLSIFKKKKEEPNTFLARHGTKLLVGGGTAAGLGGGYYLYQKHKQSHPRMVR